MDTAYSLGGQLIGCSEDNLAALVFLSLSEKFAIAPWILGRAVLESCATALWLLDPDLDVRERVRRSLGVRFASMESQTKLANAGTSGAIQQKAKDKLDAVVCRAEQLGYPAQKTERGRVTQVASKKPFWTDLVQDMLGNSEIYRVLSGFVHSDYSTILQLATTTVSAYDGGKLQMLNPNSLVPTMAAHSAASYARAAWALALQYGGNTPELVLALEKQFDALELSTDNKTRPWRARE
ncbi:MAG: hypothetical protein IID37_01580 [Planctomycetes bacterium]|nr:hypothetical protein [Planctomycetota bacterium]